MSKVLILGNGFDLYHKLPTRYTDFLFFMNHWIEFKNKYDENSDKGRDKDSDREYISVRLGETGTLTEESMEDFAAYSNSYDRKNILLLDECADNAWVEYFRKRMLRGKNWIDFENDIYIALQQVEEYYRLLPTLAESKKIVSNIISSVMQNVLIVFGGRIKENDVYTLGLVYRSDVEAEKLQENKYTLLSYMKSQLDKLNSCLNIYMLEFISRIKCNVYSEQIKDLSKVCLLNFNYTHTYELIYGRNALKKSHYIHGDINNRNLVLGIPDDTFDDSLDYVYFQKYFQRIQKKTGNDYHEWITKPYSAALENTPAEVYIMGHSLSVVDKGILKKFFCGGYVERITIFYHSQSAYEDMVINLVEMFGKNYVIDATANGTIIFEQLKLPLEISE